MKSSSSLFEKISLSAVLWIIQFVSASAQTCSCSPLTYRWTLDLSNPCPTEIPLNDGIGSDSFCKIFTTTLDPVVRVTRIQFLEYGETLADLVTYYQESGEWLDGDEMNVESITSQYPSVYTTAAGFELDGYTEAGNKVVLQWIVNYTNDCEKDPYGSISSIAWLQFSNQTPALDSTCTSSDKPNKYSKSPKSPKIPKTPKSKSPKEAKSSWSYKSPKSAKGSKRPKTSKDPKSSKDSSSKSTKTKGIKTAWSYKSAKGAQYSKSPKMTKSDKSSWSYKSLKSSKSEKTPKVAWSKGGYLR
mmetsp:Transcript_2303/g.4270  ORF Transcript_2303/g.4270 Transcript_2303/m.4270 type:complete len:301 (+) Transcript_2303:204-1106(+)